MRGICNCLVRKLIDVPWMVPHRDVLGNSETLGEVGIVDSSGADVSIVDVEPAVDEVLICYE